MFALSAQLYEIRKKARFRLWVKVIRTEVQSHRRLGGTASLFMRRWP